ncbi:OLC1v1001528C1 [Oldenlandia corymbosa var. corymbosa]|uniref:OLC1v1001528C1 n=1 Tax=Oldenlandia corymbosa var. corymbosa TaxID=529605 RepID=A0AAV1D5E9_OLDCO|nr:OLC1v1001528C1 [Oldenlandia corymbosa var. corymbosa]
MAAGRLRSGIPLLRKILAADSISSSSSAQRSTSLQRAFLAPTATNTEFARSYAAAAAPKEEKIKVPVTLFGLSGNYASALYIAAVKAKALEKVESEFLDLVEASRSSPKFSQFMKDLSVPTDIRVKALTEIASQANFSEITKNFLVVLAENGRLAQIENIARRFKEITMAHKGEVKAIVTTVIPLPPAEEKELRETLQEVIGEGKKVHIEQKIDPSILGGLVVEFSQKVFDMSIKTRARQMERFLREPIHST